MVLLTRRRLLLAALVLSTGSGAWAHSPIFSDGTATSAATAILVQDVTVSRVVYHEVTQPGSQLWVAFDVAAGQKVTFRLGVPMIDRLENFRPVLAIVGPDLPATQLPFSVPAGSGAVVLSAPEGALEPFHEQFTGTDSWIIGDLTVTFPKAGRYYAVTYAPAQQTGKLWVAMGDREAFGLDEIAAFGDIVNRVRAFHEVPEALVPCLVPLLGAGLLSAGVVRIHRRRRTL